MESLKRFLIRLPNSLELKQAKLVKPNVLKALYFALVGEGAYMETLFENPSEDEITSLESYSWAPAGTKTKPFYRKTVKKVYTHPPNQACGLHFTTGQSVYRCEQCGYDDTCVLCMYCFNPRDHEGHNVSMYVTGESGGGMCDCGDETAFVNSLNCACQKIADEDKGTLPGEMESLIETLLTLVLDYILDVTNFSVTTLPLVRRALNDKDGRGISSSQLSDLSSLPPDIYGAEDLNSEEWVLLLYNDENHDYPDAMTAIRAVTGCSERRARAIADNINLVGRSVLRTASNYHELLKGQAQAEASGLVASIVTRRDYFRELIVLAMFDWMEEIVTWEGNSAFREGCKATLAKILLKEGHLFSRLLPSELFRSCNGNLQRQFFENGLLYNGDLLNLALTEVKPGVSTSVITDSVHSIYHPSIRPELSNSIIQFLLVFEIRFPKAVRKKFSLILLPTLTATFSVKQLFCDQYLQIYPTLLHIAAFSDREEQLSSFNAITIQLFTCPRTNERVLTTKKLVRLIAPLSELIEDHASSKNARGITNLVDLVVDLRSKREKASIQKTINEGIETLSHVLKRNNNKDVLNVFLKNDNLISFLHFLKFFQGAAAIERKYGTHVEHDLLHGFYAFLQKALPVSGIVKSACRHENVSQDMVLRAIPIIFNFMTPGDPAQSVATLKNFQVSKDPVSLINPCNQFLSRVCETLSVRDCAHAFTNSGKPFVLVSDTVLRSIVLAAQVKIGFWIRNGVAVSREATYYTEVSEFGLFRDIHLNQIAALCDPPEETFLNLIDRWELTSWMNAEVPATKTVYEDRFGYLCEQLLLFLYYMLTDRLGLVGGDSQEVFAFTSKRTLWYGLCEQPKSYSELRDTLPSNVVDHPSFDDWLYECADYQAPSGLTDTGMYRLKPSYTKTLDPISLHITLSSTQSITQTLVSQRAKQLNVKESEVVLVPEIILSKSDFVNSKIGDFTRTKTFAKFCYKLLQSAIDIGSETYIFELLHLLHAVVLDGEKLHGKSYLHETFVNIPISDLLLTIVESSMSSLARSKADFLLSMFIEKDNRVIESLIDCFGDEHVQSYKKRKLGNKESESQKQKRLAEKKKAKIMENFARQRDRFEKKNKLLSDAVDEITNELVDSRRCVYCGEAENFEELFGILVCHVKSSIKWRIPNMPEFHKLAFGNLDGRAPHDDLVFSIGYPYAQMIGEDPQNYKRFVANTCGHGMHYKCYKRSLSITRALSCPLCHNVHDAFLPTFLYKQESPMLAMDSYESYKDDKSVIEVYESLFERLPVGEPSLVKAGLSSSKLASATHEENLSRTSSDLQQIFNTDNGILSVISMNSNYINISRLISDCIVAAETSQRLDGVSACAAFLQDFPSNTKLLVSSLIQSYALGSLWAHSSEKDHQLSHFEVSTSSKGFADVVFEEVVRLCFQSHQPLLLYFRWGFAKFVVATTKELSARFLGRFQSDFASIFESERLNSVSETQVIAIQRLLNHLAALPLDDVLVHALKGFYLALERCVLPFLRQCIILTDILECKQSDLGFALGSPRFADLKEKLENQEFKDSHVVLSEVLQLPTLVELVLIITSPSANTLERYTMVKNAIPMKALDFQFGGSIPYPGVVRLIDIPCDFNRTITSAFGISPRPDQGLVCLQCGTPIGGASHISHSRVCSELSIYFTPRSNSMSLFLRSSNEAMTILGIPSPYLTKHGEIKGRNIPGKATLNELRYKNLNKLWLTLGIYSFANRVSTGSLAADVWLREDLSELGEEVYDEDDDVDFIYGPDIFI